MFSYSGGIPSAYLYVDGESHYIGAERTWKKIHGQYATLESLKADFVQSAVTNTTGMPHTPRIRCQHAAKFFWDTHLIWNVFIIGAMQLIRRAVYFTGMPGNPCDILQAQQYIRECSFEPHVVLEPSNKARSRKNRLETEGVMIKAKGVDIGLAVRMLEDAHYNNYDQCWLITSDVDFLPVIRAVRRIGKKVYVLGYGLQINQSDSPFTYEPDSFIDIGEEYFSKHYSLDKEVYEKIKQEKIMQEQQAQARRSESPPEPPKHL